MVVPFRFVAIGGRDLVLRLGAALSALALVTGPTAPTILDVARLVLLPGRTDLTSDLLPVPSDHVHKTPGRG